MIQEGDVVAHADHEELGQLGTERAWVVHGSDGLDEITTTTRSHAALLAAGELTTLTIDPEAGTLTIVDNGIGMSRQEVGETIGTIASSGNRRPQSRRKANRGE